MCRRGAREAVIYIATLGTEEAPCIEGNLAKLIEIQHGTRVSPSDVDTWLRRHGKSDKELVEEATINQLEQAFPGIVAALRALGEARARNREGPDDPPG